MRQVQISQFQNPVIQYRFTPPSSSFQFWIFASPVFGASPLIHPGPWM